MRRDEIELRQPPPNDRPGDLWACGTKGDSPCSRGPDAKGRCPLADSCHPERTWHGRRKQVSMIACGSAVLVVFLAAFSQRQAEILKPGNLSAPHAQILGGTLTSQRCGACHPQSTESTWAWIWSSQQEHPPVTQSDRCLDCHHRTMDRSTARLAHNLPPRTREKIQLASLNRPGTSDGSMSDLLNEWLPNPALDQENLACGVCHQEHHGADADLLTMSDAQCQTCHSQRFGRFASSHPEWGGWPYGRGGEIAFDHASHANKHYPSQSQQGAAEQFRCVDCHPRGRDGELSRAIGFDAACARCHESSLAVQTNEGFDLLALPSLTSSSAERVTAWPVTATGFYDGKVTPLADLLLRSEDSVGAALEAIPDQDYGRIDPENRRLVAAAEKVAEAHRGLLEEIGTRGQLVLLDRASKVGLKRSTVLSLTRSISPQLIQEATRRWFEESADTPVRRLESNAAISDQEGGSALSDELLSDELLSDELLSDELLSDELLSDELSRDSSLAEAAEVTSKRKYHFDAEQLMPAGGWYLDELRTAVRYRGGGHGDPVLRSFIELIVQVPAADRTRSQWMQTPVVQACLGCHPGAVSGVPTWQSRQQVGRRDQLTKFSHRAHLNVAELSDCRHCHALPAAGLQSGSPTRVRESSPGFDSLGEDSPGLKSYGVGVNHHGFLPLSKQACVTCHIPQAAGDNCTTCHRYHVDRITLRPHETRLER